MKLFGHSKNRFSGGGVALLAPCFAIAMLAAGSGDARVHAKSSGAGATAPVIANGKVLVPKRVRLITGFKQSPLA